MLFVPVVAAAFRTLLSGTSPLKIRAGLTGLRRLELRTVARESTASHHWRAHAGALWSGAFAPVHLSAIHHRWTKPLAGSALLHVVHVLTHVTPQTSKGGVAESRLWRSGPAVRLDVRLLREARSVVLLRTNSVPVVVTMGFLAFRLRFFRAFRLGAVLVFAPFALTLFRHAVAAGCY